MRAENLRFNDVYLSIHQRRVGFLPFLLDCLAGLLQTSERPRHIAFEVKYLRILHLLPENRQGGLPLHDRTRRVDEQCRG